MLYIRLAKPSVCLFSPVLGVLIEIPAGISVQYICSQLSLPCSFVKSNAFALCSGLGRRSHLMLCTNASQGKCSSFLTFSPRHSQRHCSYHLSLRRYSHVH